MSVFNVFGVTLRHPLYDVDELLLEEDRCHLMAAHTAFLMREQLAAFVPGAAVISTAGAPGSAAAVSGRGGGGGAPATSSRDLETRAVFTSPLWVARALVPRGHAVMATPEGFSETSLREFQAGAFLPLVADTKGLRFFDHGVAVSAFLAPAEAMRVRNAALELYQKRYVAVVVEGIRTGATGARDQQLRAKLTTREQALFQSVLQDVLWRADWRHGLQ
jgi:hypothetical protein